ncbi:MAG: HD domain-containing phosphohydrolase, partial [Nitrospinales bacterium]
IRIAAELHDIGKIGIPDSILKKPGKLDDSEFLDIKNHPVLGAKSIQTIQGFGNIARIIRHHHEKFDGTGYPDGLSAEQIPFGARIIGIVDAYDAMVHTRAYRKALPFNKVLEIIEQSGGNQFDPNLTNSFIKFLDTQQDYCKDPVCGMTINPGIPVFKTTYQNKPYNFCSKVCLNAFTRTPEKFTHQPGKNEISQGS